MPSIAELNNQIQRLTADAKALYSSMDEKSKKGTEAYDGHSADTEKFHKMIADGEAKKAELDALLKLEKLNGAVNVPTTDAKDADAPRNAQFKSFGQSFIESDQYKASLAAREIKAYEWEMKDHSEGVAADGGALVWSDRRTELLEKPQRPLSIISVIPVMPTNSSSIDYVVETAGTEAAAERAEKAAAAESQLQFAVQNAVVRSIGHLVNVTEELLEDAPRLRALIDRRLGEGVMRRLEAQVVAGNGTAPNLRGIKNTVGILTRAHAPGTAVNGLGATTDIYFDTIRYGIADMALKFYRPDILAIGPVLGAKMDTKKDSNGAYYMNYDPVVKRAWGLRVVEVAGTLLANTEAIVMDSQMSCTLYDRGSRRIETYRKNDQGDKFMLTVRGSGRFAFAVEYPEGINLLTALA